MTLQEVIKKRRSIRHYTKQPVPREHVERMIQAAERAPVSCNLQLTKYIIVDDLALIAQLRKKVSYKFSYSPCYIIVLHDTRFTIKRYSGVMSAGMAVENMLLQAAELGLATCAMAGFDRDPALRRILNIPNEFEILLMISVGYEDTSFKPMDISKLKTGEIFKYNSFQNMKTLPISQNLRDYSAQEIVDYRRRISPVYLDRFRLHTFSEKAYKAALEIFSTSVEPALRSADTMLDVMSYDGTWLKLLREKKVQFQLVATDYLPENLSFLKKAHSVETVPISSENMLGRCSSPVAAASMIFQAEFTPHIEQLIGSIFENVKPGGIFFIATYQDKWFARCMKWARKQYEALVLRKHFNVYENSPYYKIGPHAYRSSSEMIEILSRVGFKNIKTETKALDGSRHSYIRTYVCEK